MRMDNDPKRKADEGYTIRIDHTGHSEVIRLRAEHRTETKTRLDDDLTWWVMLSACRRGVNMHAHIGVLKGAHTIETLEEVALSLARGKAEIERQIESIKRGEESSDD